VRSGVQLKRSHDILDRLAQAKAHDQIQFWTETKRGSWVAAARKRHQIWRQWHALSAKSTRKQG
jgi:hypothetical protein